MGLDEHEDEGKACATFELGPTAPEVLTMDPWVLREFRVSGTFTRGAVE